MLELAEYQEKHSLNQIEFQHCDRNIEHALFVWMLKSLQRNALSYHHLWWNSFEFVKLHLTKEIFHMRDKKKSKNCKSSNKLKNCNFLIHSDILINQFYNKTNNLCNKIWIWLSKKFKHNSKEDSNQTPSGHCRKTVSEKDEIIFEVRNHNSFSN
jgi:hypothetical protein